MDAPTLQDPLTLAGTHVGAVADQRPLRGRGLDLVRSMSSMGRQQYSYEWSQ